MVSIVPPRDIVVIGASREASMPYKNCRGLAASLQSTLLIVLHTSPTHLSQFPTILSRAGPLPAEHGRNGTHIECGRIYVAPPDHHMTVGPTVSLGSTKVLRITTRDRPPIHSFSRRRAYMARA